MSDTARLFDLNPHLDRKQIAATFAATGRVQIRNCLAEASARNLHDLLAHRTKWGLAWQAGADGPHNLPEAELRAMAPPARAALQHKLAASAAAGEYAFLYGQYPLIHAYLQRWAPGGPHDRLVELLNDVPFLDFAREVTGLPGLRKADAQATLYAPGHFLSLHDDSHSEEGRRVAYVLNLCPIDWRAEWGGYLQFFDEADDIVEGYRPRFNALNLFRVPQRHAVSFVPPFAPRERFAITGWFSDR